MSRHALLFILLLVFLSQISALNILAIISLPLRSHYMAMNTLFRELAIKGHNVTVINNFPDDHPTPGLEFIDLRAHDPRVRKTQSLEFYESLDSAFLPIYNVYRHFEISPSSATTDCENLFTNKNVKEHLARGVEYDVIFVEQFMSDCGLAYAAMHYDAPIIGITSHVLLPKHYPRLGIPYDISTNPHYFTNGGTGRSLYRKLETAITDLFFHTLFKWTLEKIISDVFAKYLPDKPLDMEKLSHERMKMIFSNQHYSITGGRLLAPKLLEIGGIHIQKPKSVPKNIEEFISSSEKGVIYVSFGSMLHASTMSDQKRQQFLDAFKRIPQKVIWKWENASLPAGNENVLTGSWFPQLDILCHPKVLAFVSHGGMLSMSEAAHCGTPLLTVPFFGDQFNNAASARESGLGITLFFQKINSENLVEAITELTSEKMQSNAKRVSRLWHDRPLPVMDSAIYWTEYVARHRDAPPALPTEQTTWFQTSLLDVVCIIIAIIIAILYLIYVSIRFLLRHIFILFMKVCPLPSSPENDVDLTIHVDQSARIVGGVEAPVGSLPHMVALTNGLLIRSYLCGGSIVGQRHILTAAHCIAAVFSWGSLSNSLRATVGTNRWNQGGQNYNLARNITHPHHVGSTYKNDIGILITTANIVTSNLVAVVPINYNQVNTGVLTRVAGWGRIRSGGAFSSQLLQIDLAVIDGQRCVTEVAQASIAFNIRAPAVEPHIEICTYHSPGHGTCQGDSGSALVRLDNLQQVGVVSWGFPCARGAPDMFVRLSAYRDWLQAALA